MGSCHPSTLSCPASTLPRIPLTKENRQQNDRQYNRQYQHQTTRLTPRILLIPCRAPQLQIRRPRVRLHVLRVVRDRVDLLALLAHDLRHLLEQHVQVAHALLDVPDLLLALDDQRLLEVDLGLRG